MIRPLALKDSHLVNGLGSSEKASSALNELSDYLYLVADCLTVLFHEAESLGLSNLELMETANRYLDEARDSVTSLSWAPINGELPGRVNSPDEIPTAATELARRARLLEESGTLKSIS